MRRTLVATLSAALLSGLVISLIRGTLAVAGCLALAVAALLIVAGLRAHKTRHPRYSLARLADPAPTPEEKAAGRG